MCEIESGPWNVRNLNSLSLVPQTAPGPLPGRFSLSGCQSDALPPGGRVPYLVPMTDYSDDHFRKILDTTRVIALVGFSAKPDRASHRVAKYLADQGYRVIPVNPGLAGQTFMGESVVADLSSIPKDAGVDMLDVFRASEHVPPIVETALTELPDLKTIWLQIGVTSDAASRMAAEHGLAYVEDHCPRIEHARLLG